MTTLNLIGVDPFTQVYQKLWQLLEDNIRLADLVPVHNRINYSSPDHDPYKDQIQDGDSPELSITPGDMDVRLWGSHAAVEVKKQYVIGITTMDNRVNNVERGIYPLYWELLRAFMPVTDDLDLDFVRNIRIRQAGIRPFQPDMSRDTEGWIGILNVEAEIWISRADLLASTPSWDT